MGMVKYISFLIYFFWVKMLFHFMYSSIITKWSDACEIFAKRTIEFK